MSYKFICHMILLFIVMTCELQMWMNVLQATIAVMMMQHATTLKGVIPALATLDTQAMGFIVHVSSAMFQS